jgi:putative PIN family toxin of toxin-antitoxin system
VILDTNILVSALLFKGRLSEIVNLWKQGKIVSVLSRETFEEFHAVLEYPKFSLSTPEIKMIIEEKVLPFFEVVDIRDRIKGICRDHADDKFIACALSAKADFIVTGDRDLPDIFKYKSVKIINGSTLLKMFPYPLSPASSAE